MGVTMRRGPMNSRGDHIWRRSDRTKKFYKRLGHKTARASERAAIKHVHNDVEAGVSPLDSSPYRTCTWE